jgi:hypothetical protein
LDTKEFFKLLFGKCSGGYLSLYTIPQKDTYQFRVSEYESAAHKALELGEETNTYFNVCLRKELMPNHLRGSADDVLYVPAFYSDFDIKGLAHKQDNLAESEESVIEYLHSMVKPPSVIVNSGYGMHGYWLLNEPFCIKSDEDPEYISSIARGFGKYLSSEAKKLGWKIDSVYDLARVLRVPGTYNHKNGGKKICRVIENMDKRYSVNDFLEYRDTIPVHMAVQDIDADYIGTSERVYDRCAFIRHCRDDAANLPEPEWFSAISNLALTADGDTAVHTISEPYGDYTFEETEAKRLRVVKTNKPQTCRYIHECLGFSCPEKGCGVKAPISFAVYSMAERIKKLMDSETTGTDAVSQKTLTLMAYAKEHQPADYALFKTRLKKLGLSFRDFDKAVKHEAEKRIPLEFEIHQGELLLDKLETKGILSPSGWLVSMEDGVQKTVYIKGVQTTVPISSSPIVITKRLENIDTGLEKTEIAFYRNNRWKRIAAPRSEIFNKASLMKFADSGLPVTSDSSGDIVVYLNDYESANTGVIPFTRSIGRVGWFGSEFYPYLIHGDIVFESEYNEADTIVQSLHSQGNKELWLKTAEKIRKNPLSRMLLACSFASPLLELLNHRVFVVHIWHDSRSGKTAALKFALSVWGDPQKLLNSYNTTVVGLERTCGTMKHLPFAIDELQSLNTRGLSIENIVFPLCNGFGKMRGAKSGGLQNIPTWRNIILSTGEMPMSNENSIDGINTRVLELYGRPVHDIESACEIHKIIETNYGFAGEDYIKYLAESKVRIREDYIRMQSALKEQFKALYSGEPGIHIDNAGAACLADYYASIAVFNNDSDKAWVDAINMGIQILNNCKLSEKEDSIIRAWEFTTGWVASNKQRFYGDLPPCYGTMDDKKVYILTSVLQEAIEKAGFSYGKSIKGFKERGFIETFVDAKGIQRTQFQKRIKGINTRVIAANIETSSDIQNDGQKSAEEFDDFLM